MPDNSNEAVIQQLTLELGISGSSDVQADLTRILKKAKAAGVDVQALAKHYGSASKAVKALAKEYGKTSTASKIWHAAEKKGLGELKKATGELSGALRSLVLPSTFGAAVALVDQYNKSMVAAATSSRRFGIGMVALEKSIISVGKQTALTRAEVLGLHDSWQSSVAIYKMGEFAEVTKKVSTLVGGNVEKQQEMLSGLAELSQAYPSLYAQVIKAAKATGEGAEAEKKAVIERLKGLEQGDNLARKLRANAQEYLSDQSHMMTADKKANLEKQKQIDIIKDYKKRIEEVSHSFKGILMPALDFASAGLKKLEGHGGKLLIMFTAVAASMAAMKIAGIASNVMGAKGGIGGKLAAAVGGNGQRVFVTNMAEGGMGGGGGGESGRRYKDKNFKSTRARRVAKLRAGGRYGKVAQIGSKGLKLLGGGAKLFKGLGIGAIASAAVGAGTNHMAKKAEERGDKEGAGKWGLGTNAAGIAGGAMTGAAIGSMVPVVGTLVGGLLGGAIAAFSQRGSIKDNAMSALGAGGGAVSSASASANAKAKASKEAKEKEKAYQASLTPEERENDRLAKIAAEKKKKDEIEQQIRVTKNKKLEAATSFSSAQESKMNTTFEYMSETGTTDRGKISEVIEATRQAKNVQMKGEEEKVASLKLGLSTDPAKKNDTNQLKIRKDIAREEEKILKIKTSINSLGVQALKSYEQQAEAADLQATSASLQVQLADNFAMGVGASAEMRMEAFDAEGKKLEVIEAKKAVLQDAYNKSTATGVEKEKEKAKLKNAMTKLDNESLQVSIAQAGHVKSMRDGWVSALSAMNSASGGFTDIVMTKEKGLALAQDMAGSVKAQSLGRVGAGEGYNESEIFTASGSKGGIARVSGRGLDYKEAFSGGDDTSKMETQTRKQAEAQRVKILRDRNEAAGKSDGKALGMGKNQAQDDAERALLSSPGGAPPPQSNREKIAKQIANDEAKILQIKKSNEELENKINSMGAPPPQSNRGEDTGAAKVIIINNMSGGKITDGQVKSAQDNIAKKAQEHNEAVVAQTVQGMNMSGANV